MSLSQCINALTPGAIYSIRGSTDNYSDLVWRDDTQTKPTEEEINNKRTELLADVNINKLRSERNELLLLSDIYLLSDYPHATDEDRQSWITYRQALRDLPNNNPNPQLTEDGDIDVTFPIAPNGVQRI